MRVSHIVQEAGTHALRDQLTPVSLDAPVWGPAAAAGINGRLVPFIENQLVQVDPCDGHWRDRPGHSDPGERFWCVGAIDGAVNFRRNMAEWTLTVSLFEFNEQGSAQPVLGVVHAPALGLTYLAARGSGAIRIRRASVGDKREKVVPSTMPKLEGAVVCYGMSSVPQESIRALNVVSSIAGKPADIKRIGPASLDMCKVADGTYDAYFEPHLHESDVPAVSAATVVVWEAQGQVRQWNGGLVHWRQDNDIVACNGLIGEQLQEHLH